MKVKVKCVCESESEVCVGVTDVLSLSSHSSDFVLQVSGERSYIAGQNELLSFKDIRRCIIKSEPIHLSISSCPCHLSDVPFKIHVSLHTQCVCVCVCVYSMCMHVVCIKVYV